MKENKAHIFFIAPALILLFLFSILPIFVALIISFTDLSLSGLADWSRINFVEFDNYIDILSDETFYIAIQNTLYYVLIGVPLILLLSLLIAILLHLGGNSKYFSFLRLAFYSPSITNIVAVAIVWAFLYNPHPAIGLINKAFTAIGLDSVAWLQDTEVAKISLIILGVWRGIGINMLIFSAALQNIPDTLYEAAELDGATRWQQIIYVTLPQLSYSIFFVAVTTVIGWLQFFEEPFVMTEGGPLNSTMSVSLFIYKNGFKFNRFGFASAGSLLLFVVIILVTILQLKIQDKKNKNTY